MNAKKPSRWIRLGFGLTLFLSALTGFAQMPIFKRYYIADLPGLGWLAQFYTTYWLHYISAIAFIAIAAYLSTDYLLLQRKYRRLTLNGWLRGGMLMVILATGALLVYRNMPGYRFPPRMVVALDFTHLGMVVLFLMTSLVAGVFRRPWTVTASAAPRASEEAPTARRYIR
jgi:hypothetical protein